MQTDNKMGTASINKLILTMSLPPLFSMFLQYSYNLIDSAFVAQLSENALTAVSLSFPLITIMNLFCGFTTMIATYFRAIDRVIESNILQLMRQLVVLLPAMWVLNHTMQISGIWISFPVTELISFGASIILLMIYNRKSKNKQGG